MKPYSRDENLALLLPQRHNMKKLFGYYEKSNQKNPDLGIQIIMAALAFTISELEEYVARHTQKPDSN